MAIYTNTSRYYKCDEYNGIPQQDMTVSNYPYDNVTVLSTEDGRLDLVSYRVYNTPINWWIIARFNGIINPDSVKAGDTLRIPRNIQLWKKSIEYTTELK